MVVSGSSSVSGLHRETTVLSLVMAYRSFGRFRRASTRLDTPPCSGRHHPVSAIAQLTPALAEGLRRRRRGKAGCSWYVDETYVKVNGRWCYLYRAIDRSGTLVDVMFSEHRDMAAAQAFFRSAKAVTGVTPDRVT